MRKLTIVIEANQPLANWLWDCHMSGKETNGIKVIALHEGNALDELDELRAKPDLLDGMAAGLYYTAKGAD